MVRLTIDTVSIHTLLKPFVWPSVAKSRGLFVQAAGSKMREDLAILREWAKEAKTSGLSQAQDRIPGKAHALRGPNRLQQNHHEEPPTPSALAFLPSLHDYPAMYIRALGKTNTAARTMKKLRQSRS